MSRSLLPLLSLLSLAAEGHVISLSSMYGSLESPNFPEPYPRDLDLVWDVRVRTGFRIRLDFSHFHLEPSYLCEYDYVKVESDGELLGLFCGSESTDTEAVPGLSSLVSPSSSLSVSFRTDYSDEDKYSGFRAHFTAEDVDECVSDSDEDFVCDHFCHNFIGGFYCSCRHGYKLHPDNRTCTVHCSDGVFRERSGVLSSPDFPGPYPKSSDCRYQIQVQTGFRVRLVFGPVFDVEDHPEAECPYDFVTVEAGARLFGPFCGSVAPGPIETESSSVTVQFHSDNSGLNQGWTLNYTSTGSVCPAPETPPLAVLTPVQSEYSFTDHALFTCQSGYRILKDGRLLQHLQIHCLSDGTWSSGAPLCQEVDCGAPEAVDEARVVFLDGNSTKFGARIRYECENLTALNENHTALNENHTALNENHTALNENHTALNENHTALNENLHEFKCEADGKWTRTSPGTSPGTSPPSCRTGCGLSRSLPALVKRIVGGRTAEPGMFPWQVLISVQDRTRIPEENRFGSGSLLSQTWVLTAAHVVRSSRRDGSVVPVQPQHVQVFLGVHSARLKHQAQQRIVGAVVLHPDFQPQNYNNDIALLRLSSAAQFSDVIGPVCLPPIRSQTDPPLPEPLSLGVVAGWGVSSANATPDPAPTSDLLQFVKLPVVAPEECAASYASRSGAYNITDGMFCAGFSAGGRDTCLGDSGGAFVARGRGQGRGRGRWAVLGIVSWAGPEDCGSQRVYGVYTRVGHYRDWIQEHLDQDQDWTRTRTGPGLDQDQD